MKVATIDRFFLIVFTVIVLFTVFWIIHTRTVLQNEGLPTNVVRLFDLNNDLLYNVVTIFSIILLLLANIFFWRTGRGIYFFWSVVYFIVGIIAYAIMENARFYYIRQNGLWNRKLSAGFIVSVYLISIVIIISLIDFFIINYLRKKSLLKKQRYERLFTNKNPNLN